MARFLWQFVILLTTTLSVAHALAGEERDNTPTTPEFEDDLEDDEDSGPYVPVEWLLLRFSEQRQITKATLVLRDKRTDDGYEDGTTIEFDSPELLAQLQSCFRMHPLRLATPDDGLSGMGWGSINFGELKIATTQDRFFIDLGWEGFHLNRRSTNADAIFWQGKLARLIDEVYFEKTKQRLRHPGGLSLAESHVQFLTDLADLRPEVTVPSDEKVQRANEERRQKREERRKQFTKPAR